MGSQIRYIVLTDVHLGAGNSILTQVTPGQTVADVHHPSPALLSLADCLGTLVLACNGTGRPPTLIAAGDLIDLALSPAERALPVFGQLAEALMTGDEPVIADEVLLLPGNHDHLTWDYARQRWLEDRLVAAGGRLHGGPSHRIGPMLLDREPAIASVPLTALLRGSTGRAGRASGCSTPTSPCPRPTGAGSCWSPTATTSTRCAPACPSSPGCSPRTQGSPRTPRRWSARTGPGSTSSSPR